MYSQVMPLLLLRSVHEMYAKIDEIFLHSPHFGKLIYPWLEQRESTLLFIGVRNERAFPCLDVDLWSIRCWLVNALYLLFVISRWEIRQNWESAHPYRHTASYRTYSSPVQIDLWSLDYIHGVFDLWTLLWADFIHSKHGILIASIQTVSSTKRKRDSR